MKLSVSITDYTWPDADFRSRPAYVASGVDEAGLDTIWVSDHLLQADPSLPLETEVLKAHTT